MKSKQAKRAAPGGKSPSKSPSKKPKGGGTPSILSFFGHPHNGPPKKEDSHQVCVIDDSQTAAHDSSSGQVCVIDDDDDQSKAGVPKAQGQRHEVIDLDSDDARGPADDAGGSDGRGAGSAVMQLQAGESMSKSEAGADPRKVLSDAYDPEADACWKRGEGAPFLHLARTFACIDNEKGRYKLRTAVSNMFRSILRLSPQDTLAAVHLTLGKIASAHEDIELNVGGAAVCDAIAEVTGVGKAKILTSYTELGDLGDVAQSFRRSQQLLVQPAPLLISTVFKTMREIAGESGQGSAARRKAKMMRLLRGCREQVCICVRACVYVCVRGSFVCARVRMLKCSASCGDAACACT
jgi:hypothetical protein